MIWNLKDDTLSFCQIPDIGVDEVITLRSIKKRLPRHYDPLGILQCVTMAGTKFQSDLQEKGHQMDQQLNQEDLAKYKSIYAEIQKATRSLG